LASKKSQIPWNIRKQRMTSKYKVRSYMPWTDIEDEFILRANMTITEKALKLNRSYYSILYRLRKLKKGDKKN